MWALPSLLADVKDDSPADQTGLKQGSPVEVAVGLQRLVTRTAVGMKVPVKVVRDGHKKYLTVTIGEQSDTTKVAKAEPNEKDYAFVGVIVQDLDRDLAEELGIKGKAQGVMVTSVEPDNGAEKASLAPGDVIRKIHRQPVKFMKDFEKLSSSVKKGDNMLILINRRDAIPVSESLTQKS